MYYPQVSIRLLQLKKSIRIHSFLEYWGLINYNVAPDLCAPRGMKLQKNGQVEQQRDLSAVEQMLDFSRESKEPKSSTNLPLRKNVFFTSVSPPQVLMAMQP